MNGANSIRAKITRWGGVRSFFICEGQVVKIFLCILMCGIVVHCSEAQWSDPVLMDDNMDSVGINTQTKEWCPFISADGQYFWFAREHTNNDLYVCHREGEAWSTPLKLPFCTEIGDERNPTTNATNDTLYFITFSEGWDMFWSFRTGPSDTSWSTPERLPQPINSNGIEFSVWCTPDNQRLLFSSWRIGANGEDIYECRRDGSTQTGWSDPSLLPGRINTGNAGFTESYPSMGLDSTELFFWGRYSYLYRSVLTDSGWSVGDSLPPNINRVIFRDPTERTPCITPDEHRLYFMSCWAGSDSTSTAGDVWYTDRTTGISPIHSRHLNGSLRISVYPNPARERIWIQLSGGVRRAAVFDLLGRQVLAQEFGPFLPVVWWNPNSFGQILPSGIYFVTAENTTERTSVKLQIIK